jgi:hypothetical protein
VKQHKLGLVRDPEGARADTDGSVVHGREESRPNLSSPLPIREPVPGKERNLARASAWHSRSFVRKEAW